MLAEKLKFPKCALGGGQKVKPQLKTLNNIKKYIQKCSKLL